VLRAIIFDVDGTLAETEEIHRAAFNQAFEEAGLAWRWSAPLYAELLKVTGGKERLRHYAWRIGRISHLEDEQILALHRRKTAIYTEIIRSGRVALRPGVEALIEGARRMGLRLAIATTTSYPNVEALLRSTFGETGPALFDAIAAGDAVPRKKPAPDVFLSALAALDLTAEDCVAIEDSENGLRSARAAGLETIVTPSRYTDGEDFAGALCVVETLDELAHHPWVDPGADAPAPETIVEAVSHLHKQAVSRTESEAARHERG